MGDKGRQDPQWETRGDKTLGRRTHHPTKETRREAMGDKGRQDPLEGGHTIQQRETEGVQWETKGDKTLGKADTPSHTKADTLK